MLSNAQNAALRRIAGIRHRSSCSGNAVAPIHGRVSVTSSKMSTTSAQECRQRIQREGGGPSLCECRMRPESRASAEARASCISTRAAARFATRRRSQRIRALVLPPAWTDVWISTDPRAHLQATGRDAAGRKQYRYHASWTAERDSTKYHRMLAFAEVLPAIRKRTRRDLMGPAHCRPRVLATVVELLARTYIRIGNEEYMRKQQVTWLDDAADRHVTVRGRKLNFAFRGKSGVFQRNRDRRAASRARGARMPGPAGTDAVSVSRR